MYFPTTSLAFGLHIGLLMSPTREEAAPRPGSEPAGGGVDSSPVEPEHQSKWGGEGSIGAHLSFPGQELRRTTDPVGLGLHLFFGGTYGELPLLVGLKFGWTDFLPRHGTYTFGGEERYWELQRQTVWVGPAVRLLPRTWAFRPYLEAAVGGWFHWIELTPADAWNSPPGESLSNTVTGMYSLGAGVTWKFRKVLTLELSLDYLHGGSSRMPVVSSENGALAFDTVQSGNIEQWSAGLGVGGRF